MDPRLSNHEDDNNTGDTLLATMLEVKTRTLTVVMLEVSDRGSSFSLFLVTSL